MKSSLLTTLLALTAMTLMVITVGSSGLRGLQSQEVSVENLNAAVPSVKISGVSTLLQILNSASDFTNAPFDVITLDSFSQKTTDQGVVYEGKVTVANDQGVNVTGIVTGVYDSASNKIVFDASKYEVETEDSDTEGEQSDGDDDGQNSADPDDLAGYTIIDIEVAKNDPAVSTIFNWSAQKLIETGERQNKIPISNYTVTEWSSAAYKNKSNGVYYKFEAKLLGENYVHVETRMATFKYTNETLLLAGYYYRATNITKGSLPNNFTEIDNNNNTNSTNNTVVIPPYVPAGYTYISSADLVNNSQAQLALLTGVNLMVQKAIAQYKLPATSPEYNVTNLILAAYKNQSFGATYIFWTNTSNALNYKLDANITVSYRAATQAYLLVGYSYHSYGYPSNSIVIPQNNTSTNNNTNSTDNNGSSNTTIPDNSTVVDPDNTTQPVNPDNTTQPVDNSTQPVDNSTVIDNNSTTNATEPVNNNTAAVNQTAPEGYTLIPAEKFANDSIAQSALQTGVNSLVQKMLSQNKIPTANPNYSIQALIMASEKKGKIGTSYKFTVNLTNVDYVRVDANLTVFYRYSTKALSLNGYSFRSYNYSASAINNNNNGSTNTTAPAANSTDTGSSSNSTVVDNGSAANNTTSTDETAAAPVDVPADNSTVVDNSGDVAGDNSATADNGDAADSTESEAGNADAGSR